MHFKKTALLAMCSFALLGCGPKTKIDSGTTITATLWQFANSDTFFAGDLALSNDEKTQGSLRAMKCEVNVAYRFNPITHLHEANKATLSCEKKDMVNFAIELFGPDGQPGIATLKVGDPIVMKLKETVTI